MKRKRYTEEQIVRILNEVESGQTVVATSRKYGVSEQSIHRWKSKYGGMKVSELRRLKALEEENSRLKKIVADQAARTRVGSFILVFCLLCASHGSSTPH